jgi:predicted PP-loop superfamily ATPase
MEISKKLKRCQRCILAEDFPNIHFDADGICNYCHAWDRQWKNFDYRNSERELRGIFDVAKGKKRRYDCLIPYSGGRDSSYVLYLCKTKYELNPLVVTFNNLFMSDHALKNIFTTLEKLDVDHIFVTYKSDIIKQFYATMVKRGGEFCSVCTTGINYVTITYQRIFNIPLVISGTSMRVDEQSPFEVTCTHPKYIRRVLSEQGYSMQGVNTFLLKRQDEASAFEKIRMKLFDADYVRINLPDFLQWDNQEIQRVLEQELKWTTPDKQQDHIDCKFAPIKYYLKNKQIPHYIFKQEKFSQLIRDGQLTREDAMKALNESIKHEHDEPAELKDFLEFLKLNSTDIENPTRRSHLNYVDKEELEPKESMAFKLLSLPWKVYKRMKGAG